jgi:hypothetical protein
MPSNERTKKRKADLLLDSAKKCQKLSDLFGQSRQQTCRPMTSQPSESTTTCNQATSEASATLPLSSANQEPPSQSSILIITNQEASDCNSSIASDDVTRAASEVAMTTAKVVSLGAITSSKLKSSTPKNCNIKIKTNSASFYKGIKLDLITLLKTNKELDTFDTTKDSKKRVHVSCKLCYQYIVEAKYSRNGTAPIATGVRADGEDRLKLA